SIDGTSTLNKPRGQPLTQSLSTNSHIETLRVSFMQDVKWNDQAFEDLVIDPNTKDLVKAVVTNTLREEENLDLIEGKGNGLCILLHG
ncbi:P-loop containing nucleoside triphosphate hydrolase, partial [Colletotrichum chrysophilum]